MDDLPQQLADLTPSRVRELLRVPDDTPVSVERIGEGFGLASVVARIDVGTGAKRNSFAVKLCEATLADAEAYAYTVVLSPVADMPIPDFVRAVSDGGRGVVITEFVGGGQGDVLAGCTNEVAEELTRSVARLHAAWWNRPNPDLPIVLDRMDRPLERSTVETVVARHGDLLSPDGIGLLRSLPDRVEEAVARLRRRPSAALHADLHLDNVVLTAGGPVLLDWAGVRWGPPAIDVARCLVEFGGGSARGLLDAYRDEIASSAADTTRLDHDVDAALVASLPLTLRWAARHAHPPATREHALVRATLHRFETLLT